MSNAQSENWSNLLRPDTPASKENSDPVAGLRYSGPTKETQTPSEERAPDENSSANEKPMSKSEARDAAYLNLGSSAEAGGASRENADPVAGLGYSGPTKDTQTISDEKASAKEGPTYSGNWSSLLRSDETIQQEARKQEGPSAWDKAVSSLAGAGNFASGFVAEQVRVAGSDFVSRVLYGESYSPPEHGREQEKDRARDLDQGVDR